MLPIPSAIIRIFNVNISQVLFSVNVLAVQYPETFIDGAEQLPDFYRVIINPDFATENLNGY